ncbi:hypothetical protein GGR50DRAFT_498463 [Xylaria sp. CBS 124048]|nr:hypothetical protein GGR50DRAFT_498463 [Xylaria sp. CBS 124048]
MSFTCKFNQLRRDTAFSARSTQQWQKRGSLLPGNVRNFNEYLTLRPFPSLPEQLWPLPSLPQTARFPFLSSPPWCVPHCQAFCGGTSATTKTVHALCTQRTHTFACLFSFVRLWQVQFSRCLPVTTLQIRSPLPKVPSPRYLPTLQTAPTSTYQHLPPNPKPYRGRSPPEAEEGHSASEKFAPQITIQRHVVNPAILRPSKYTT